MNMQRKPILRLDVEEDEERIHVKVQHFNNHGKSIKEYIKISIEDLQAVLLIDEDETDNTTTH